MGWSIGYDVNWKRDVGYGVPAYCDHPDCNEVIDRGLVFVCSGEEPYGGENGCGLYFCEDHKKYGKEGDQCQRCALKKDPYVPKQDHPDWIKHKMTDPSWAKWREENSITS